MDEHCGQKNAFPTVVRGDTVLVSGNERNPGG